MYVQVWENNNSYVMNSDNITHLTLHDNGNVTVHFVSGISQMFTDDDQGTRIVQQFIKAMGTGGKY